MTRRPESRSSVARLAICTYQRPDLLREALAALARQQCPAGWQVELLVVDNDPERSASPVVDCFRGSSTFANVTYIVEPSRGVGNARNAALRQDPDFDVLIFFDDDQVPSRDWLLAILTHHESDPDALWCGPVIAQLPDELPDWARGGWAWNRPLLIDGSVLSVCGDGNLLIPRSIVESGEYRYSTDFGRGMGQDAELTHRLSSSGSRIRYARDATAIEEVTPDRLTREWVLDRAFRSSEAWARILVATGINGRFRLALPALKRVVSFAALTARGLVQRRSDLLVRGRRDWAMVRGYRLALSNASKRQRG